MLSPGCQAKKSIFGGVYKTPPKVRDFIKKLHKKKLRIIFLIFLVDSAEKSAFFLLVLLVFLLARAAALLDGDVHEDHIVADAHDLAPRDDHLLGLGKAERGAVADDQRDDFSLAGLKLDVGDKPDIRSVPHIDDILLTEVCC